MPHKESFRRLYSIVFDPLGRVIDSFDAVGNVWTSKLRINLNDWGFGEMLGLLMALEGIKPDPFNCDSWEWVLSKKGALTSNSMYLEQFDYRSISFPDKRIWIPDIPSKVSFFMWNAYLDKILTLDNLQSRSWNLANKCILCLKEEESVDQLFVHCDIETMVWGFFLSILKIRWTFPRHVWELISGWFISNMEVLPSIVWGSLPGAICWGIVERKEQ